MPFASAILPRSGREDAPRDAGASGTCRATRCPAWTPGSVAASCGEARLAARRLLRDRPRHLVIPQAGRELGDGGGGEVAQQRDLRLVEAAAQQLRHLAADRAFAIGLLVHAEEFLLLGVDRPPDIPQRNLRGRP